MKQQQNKNNKQQETSAAKLQVINESKRETETQKAARKAEREKERERKAAAKAEEQAKAKAVRVAMLEQQKSETRRKHENAKSALNYNTYGVIKEQRESTPAQACKHFYLDMQALCGGALLQVLAKILGNDKRDFYEIYGARVKAKADEKGLQKYTAFLVWGVLWEDLQKYTRGEMKASAEMLAAISQVQIKVEERAERIKAQKAAKAAAK